MLSLHGKDYISPEIFEYAITDHTKDLPSLSRGLGFQLYRDGVFPGGCQLSRGSYGHTGFTGTSIYVDKSTDCFCILLTTEFISDATPISFLNTDVHFTIKYFRI